MIFGKMWREVLDGTKTQTRRRLRRGEDFLNQDPTTQTVMKTAPSGHHFIKWQVGKTYAVQRSRSEAAIGRIELLRIWPEDARNILRGDVKAEGFDSFERFILHWCRIYDPDALLPSGCFSVDVGDVRDYLQTRPAKLYQCWALRFKVCFIADDIYEQIRTREKSRED